MSCPGPLSCRNDCYHVLADRCLDYGLYDLETLPPGFELGRNPEEFEGTIVFFSWSLLALLVVCLVFWLIFCLRLVLGCMSFMCRVLAHCLVVMSAIS